MATRVGDVTQISKLKGQANIKRTDDATVRPFSALQPRPEQYRETTLQSLAIW